METYSSSYKNGLVLATLTEDKWNRDAFRTFDSYDTYESQVVAFRTLGSSHIGESIDLVQNVDRFFMSPHYEEELTLIAGKSLESKLLK